MVRLQGPLMSMSAQKQLGHELIYKQKGGKSFLTHYNKPGGKNPFKSSPTQKDKRMIYNLIIARWQTLTDEQKAVYNDLVTERKLNMSGWNYFYQQSLLDLPTYLGLVGYWSFNEIVGGKILDLSGKGNDLVLKPSYPTNAPILIDSIGEKFGKAGYFDGIDDWGEAGQTTIPQNSNLTMSIRTKLDGLNQTTLKRIIIKAYGSIAHNRAGSIIWINSEQKFAFVYPTSSTATGDILITNPFTKNNTWVNVVGVFDNTNGIARIYIDGILDKEITGLGTVITPTGTSNLSFATEQATTTPTYFKGSIDEAIIYSRALSTEEISKIYKLTEKK